MQINLQSAHPLSGTSIIKKLPSCKRTRAGSTLLRTTCYTIRAEFCQYLSHLTAGTPSVPTFCQFRERNSGVIFSRSYLHRASTCPRLSAAFCANFPIWHCLTRKSCSLLSPSLFLRDCIYILYYNVYNFYRQALFPGFTLRGNTTVYRLYLVPRPLPVTLT